MKPPFIITPNKWRFDIANWLTEQHNHKDLMLVKWKNGTTTVIAKGGLHYSGITAPYPSVVVEQVLAIAELPDTDPICEKFNFITAAWLMKAGYNVLSNRGKEYTMDIDGFPYDINAKTSEDIDTVRWDEIIGKWRLSDKEAQ